MLIYWNWTQNNNDLIFYFKGNIIIPLIKTNMVLLYRKDSADKNANKK